MHNRERTLATLGPAGSKASKSEMTKGFSVLEFLPRLGVRQSGAACDERKKQFKNPKNI
jgi:hypothetical protein